MNNTMGAQTPEGRMYDAIEVATQDIRAKQPTLNAQERELISLYRKLPDLDQKAIADQTRSWVELYKKRAKSKKRGR